MSVLALKTEYSHSYIRIFKVKTGGKLSCFNVEIVLSDYLFSAKDDFHNIGIQLQRTMRSGTNLNISLTDLSDEELVARYVRHRDNQAFGVLYKRYVHLVYGSALKYMKDEETARDMVAQVFEKLYRKLPDVNVQNFKGYLYGSVRNECIARLRQAKSERLKKDKYSLDENIAGTFMENEGMQRLLESDESVEEKVAEAVNALSAEQKLCVTLFFFEKKSYKEITEMTDFDLKQVKSYLQNGKRNLRNSLSQMLERYS